MRFTREHPTPVVPGPGQESVWDFPRPPRLEPVAARVRVELGGHVIADTTRAMRVCETASPPTYYIPPDDVDRAALVPTGRASLCEWKGAAQYWSIRVSDVTSPDAAWSYPAPRRGFEPIRDYLAFYAGRDVDCFVGDALVEPQPGRFYGGWVTPGLVGPFKGEPGTEHW